jgi:(5-formylfuran-3-yl)methyl phosphate synthase
MTGLLASVTNLNEADSALAAGADIIDLKDPSRGALGALSLARIKRIVAAIDHRCSVSATVGDLPAKPNVIGQAVRATAATGVAYVKVGLFGSAYFGDCLDRLAEQASAGARLIAVLFADLAPDFKTLAMLADAGFTGAMLDTAVKSRGGLRRHMSVERLGEFVRQARRSGLVTGLAGSLRCEDIDPLLATKPDYLGFRTALCRGESRTAEIDPEAVAAIRARLPQAGVHAPSKVARQDQPAAQRAGAACRSVTRHLSQARRL